MVLLVCLFVDVVDVVCMAFCSIFQCRIIIIYLFNLLLEETPKDKGHDETFWMLVLYNPGSDFKYLGNMGLDPIIVILVPMF